MEGIRGLLRGGKVLAGVSTLDESGLVVRVLGGNVPSVQKVLRRVIGLIRKNVLSIEGDSIPDRLLGAL